MSKQYDNTNSGTLFKNDVSGKSENFPGYGGSLNVEGKEYFISAWVKEGKSGKFFSLSVKPKEAKQERKAPPAPVSDDPFGDSLPDF